MSDFPSVSPACFIIFSREIDKDTDFQQNGKEKDNSLNVPRLFCECEIRHVPRVPAHWRGLGSGAAAQPPQSHTQHSQHVGLEGAQDKQETSAS